MSKYCALIEQTKNQNTEKPETLAQVARAEKSDVKDVNLSIKAPKSERQHWVLEAENRELL